MDGVQPAWLQPIETRIVMLQTGFRAKMGVKIYGSDPQELERIGLQIEQILKRVPGAVDVVPDRIVGKPYIEIEPDRDELGRYGVNIRDVNDIIEIAIGGENLTYSVEGRERYPIRVRYPRELREWRSRFDMEVEVTVDRATADWQGAVGVVTRLVERAPFDPGSAMAFVCGPEIMIRFAVMALEQRGVAARSVHVSMERNMKCAVGLCGHCQLGPFFVCKDGPVFRYDQTMPFFGMREV